MVSKIRIIVIIFTLYISALVSSGCIEDIQNKVSDLKDNIMHYISKFKLPDFDLNEVNLVKNIATLPQIKDSSINTFEGYHNLCDSFNAIFTFLNREGGYDFQYLKGTQEEYSKLSKVITEYTPLLNNYNCVVKASKEYNENNPESVEEYHKALALFGLEMMIIYATVWYTPSFKIVGMVYRWSGLNRFAFKYPTLISFILSKTHWAIRGTLVEGSTGIADYILDSFGLIHGIRD
jgi:hypothetical protein